MSQQREMNDSIGALKISSDEENDADDGCQFEIRQRQQHSHPQFDEIIGHIEDIFLDDGFHNLNVEFLEKHWQQFQPGDDENKLIYMDIFQTYNRKIENYLGERLHESIPSFCMESFLNQLREKSPNLEGEIFEILSTVTDFLAFKDMLLDYRAAKEGTVEDLSTGITIKSLMKNRDERTDHRTGG